MTETEKTILGAAVRMFTRYGVKRTSMGDLAQEAGVSRQTLYNTYKNKDDVLRALIRFHTRNALSEIEAELGGIDHLGGQLDIVFDRMVLGGFDLVREMPNAQDLIDGFNAAGQEEMTASAEEFRLVIQRLLSPHRKALANAGLDLSDLSDFVQRSAKSAGSVARDRDHLVRLLQTLRNLCLAATGQSR
ncbi:TetR/AcrR family transcriptional regulator [Thalassococcus sp. CAU 1522]|uniref:TetR/AcrR family transcriptional regulator n=1 Tax=Thalassococcus arenae TaxID=2851652 RepID=A0ABS6NBY7_9RHOB|nr:TetR family transcriptional regulator [Thalassococcus arenae]MBV2361508.1 TetR/AcrR family transcriptional regulator [Thalassococcus arenae]